MSRTFSTLGMIGLAALMACSSSESGGARTAQETLVIHADQDLIRTREQLVRHATSVVVGRPVGSSTAIPVEMPGTEPVFANVFRDLAISRTIYGSATGAIRIVTVGWNQESQIVASGNVAFDGLPIPMLGEVPEGEAIFFLKKFPDIPEFGPLAGVYEVVGQGVGRVPVSAETSLTGPGDEIWTSAANAEVREFAGRDLMALTDELRTLRDDFEASEACEEVVGNSCPEGPGVTYVKAVESRVRGDGTLELVRTCCRYPASDQPGGRQ